MFEPSDDGIKEPSGRSYFGVSGIGWVNPPPSNGFKV